MTSFFCGVLPPRIQPPDWYAMLLETLQDPCVEGGAFEGGEEFTFRSVRQPPPERDTAEFGVHQDASVPVVVKQNDSLARHIYMGTRCDAQVSRSPGNMRVAPVLARNERIVLRSDNDLTPIPELETREAR